MSIQDVIAEGRRRAERLLGRVIDQIPGFENLRDLLEQASHVEQEMLELYLAVKQLDLQGQATASDFRAYNTMRTNLSRTQGRLLTATRQFFTDRPDILRVLPRRVASSPPLYPKGIAAALPSFTGAQASGDVAGLRGGLGTAPAAAPIAAGSAGVAMAPWMIAGLILAAIVGITVIGYAAMTSVGLIAEAVSNVIVIREQVRAYRLMIDARLRVYNDCRSQGRSPDECARLAASAVPTPRDAQIQLPEMGSWVKWVAIGLGIVAIASVGGYVLYQRSQATAPAQLSGARAKFRPIRADRFADEPIEDDGLPV